MKVIIPGHQYLLACFEDKNYPEGGTHPLQFIQKENVDGELKTIMDGTTNEEVLRALIDRLQYLNQLLPCRENSLAITKLEEALMWLQKRTDDREARKVKGTLKK